jgi:D-galactarolactone cycloisomerase
MRITRIETIPLKMPLPRVYKGSYYQMTHRCTIIIRLYTDEGIIGESYNGDELESQAELIKIIHEEIAPKVIGMDAFNVEGCWQAALDPSYNILRDRRLATQAQALVDSAVWDAVGKALKQPLYRLWGGYRDKLQVIAIAGYYAPDNNAAIHAQEMESLREMGLAGCKFKVGKLSPEEDAKRVRAAREGGGEDFILAVDANQGYTEREAIRFTRLVEDLNIRWFEEPVRWYNDRLGMASVRQIGGIPVTAGQSEMARNGCRDLMMSGAIDVCNFDASWSGGPTEWRRVAALAACFDVEMGHHEEPQIAAHLLASIPHGTYLEVFHPDRDPLFYALMANRPAFDNGWYQVPSGPGLGMVLDQDVIAKYRVD